MAKTVFDVLDERLAEHQRSIQDFMCGGSAENYAAYKDACGAFRGLAIARREIEDLSRNYMEDEDD
jgi:hypothetical protein